MPLALKHERVEQSLPRCGPSFHSQKRGRGLRPDNRTRRRPLRPGCSLLPGASSFVIYSHSVCLSLASFSLFLSLSIPPNFSASRTLFLLLSIWNTLCFAFKMQGCTPGSCKTELPVWFLLSLFFFFQGHSSANE